MYHGNRLVLAAIAIWLLPSAGIADTFDDGNPGESAMECVERDTRGISYSDSHEKLVFRNRCNHEIFIAYCGDFKFYDQDCGDGKEYYTHATPEIEAGGTEELTLAINGHYEYAACKGGHGFDISEWFRADGDGDFRCLATGAYANEASAGDGGGGNGTDGNQSATRTENARPVGRWAVEIGNDEGEWPVVLTMKADGDATYHSVSEGDSYPARWDASGGRVTFWAYGTRQHYERDDPALRIDLEIDGDSISGTQYNLLADRSELWVQGSKE